MAKKFKWSKVFRGLAILFFAAGVVAGVGGIIITILEAYGLINIIW